jgi:hypothetical protein
MTSRTKRSAIGLVAVALAAGCAVVPTSPYVAALPGSRTTPQQFASDDGACRAQAQAYFGPGTAQPANDAAAANVVAGTLIGAAIGALFGAAVGDAGGGAAFGAGAGLLGGSVAAADVSGYSSGQLQARYDSIYLQCMYAAGHRVPASAVANRSYRSYPVPSGAAPAAGYPPANAPPPARSYPPPTSVAPPAGFPPPDAPPPDRAPRG